MRFKLQSEIIRRSSWYNWLSVLKNRGTHIFTHSPWLSLCRISYEVHPRSTCGHPKSERGRERLRKKETVACWTREFSQLFPHGESICSTCIVMKHIPLTIWNDPRYDEVMLHRFQHKPKISHVFLYDGWNCLVHISALKKFCTGHTRFYSAPCI